MQWRAALEWRQHADARCRRHVAPGGTAVFEISYPLNPSSVGKEFTILDCAYINDVATLKYIVSFVPSNASFVLRMTLAVPAERARSVACTATT